MIRGKGKHSSVLHWALGFSLVYMGGDVGLAFTTQAYFHEKGVFTNKKRLATGIPRVFLIFLFYKYILRISCPLQGGNGGGVFSSSFPQFCPIFLVNFSIAGKVFVLSFPFRFFLGEGHSSYI